MSRFAPFFDEGGVSEVNELHPSQQTKRSHPCFRAEQAWRYHGKGLFF